MVDPGRLPVSYQATSTDDTDGLGLINDGSFNAGRRSSGSRKIAGIAAIAVTLIVGASFYSRNVAQDINVPVPASLDDNPTDDSASFDDLGRFVLRNYDTAKPFASFLPGLGGKYGLPMWAFYVNRGQGIAAFGTENKEHPLMEFSPANKAYQQTPYVGFRTFLKGTRDGDTWLHQPFFPENGDGSCTTGHPERDMLVGMNELEIVETNDDLGLNTKIQYFTLPDEDFAALVRRSTFTNTGDTDLELEILDGMPKIEPFGVFDWHLKNMGRTLEGWFKAFNYEESAHTLPFYKLTASILDSEEVTMIIEGNWAVSYIEEDGELMDGSVHNLLPFIADPAVVFGQLDTPMMMASPLREKSVREMLGEPMVTLARTPCALAGTTATLAPGASIIVTSIYGRAKDEETFTTKIAPIVSKRGYISMKHNVAAKLTSDLTDVVDTNTALPIFDAHVRQMFLDNVLRGGFPVMLGNEKTPKVYHTFSRIHGDLERDYNYFKIDLTYFSQGPGNFRDVNQNRRTDVLLDPLVGDFNVRTFLTFVQSDGYNPLTVDTSQFLIRDKEAMETVLSSAVAGSGSVHMLRGLLERPFRPGDLFQNIETQNIELTMDRDDFLNLAAEYAEQVPQANFSQNGFWADHWTYHLDLIDNFLTVFPDQEEDLLFDSEPIPFFLSPAQVNPRNKKYVLANEKAGTVRQYGCIAYDSYKQATQKKMETDVDGIWMRAPVNPPSKEALDKSVSKKDGPVFKVTIGTKLILLATMKFSQLDPKGMGVEMEGGKPGWNDAMNGLPGMIGSGMPETYELLRLLRFVRNAMRFDRTVTIPEELHTLHQAIMAELDDYATTGSDFKYWDSVATARETYRNETTYYFSGKTVDVPSSDMEAVLAAMVAKTEAGVQRATDLTKGLTPTYFSYEVTDFSLVLAKDGTQEKDSVGRPFVKANAFRVHTFPMFLEGFVRHFKVLTDQDSKQELYQQVRASTIYDDRLKMYKLSESLAGQSFEMGRMMAFAPGWLENTSVWLHMSYKLYLEMIRAGLFSEFWEEVKTGFVAFMDPAVFGRSPLEAASFIVSSMYPDEKLHGTGFLARLSGSTAEFLSMWHLMMQGPTPFVVDEEVGTDTLALKLEPALPDWLFTDDDTVSFTFLGAAVITYHNPDRRNTWELENPTSAVIVGVDGTKVELDLEDGIIPPPYATLARSKEIASIDVYYESRR